MSQTSRSPKGAGSSTEDLTRNVRTATTSQGEDLFLPFRQRHYEGLHAGLRAKLARAQYVLWKDPEGYQRGESLLALGRAVSAFLKEAPLAPVRGPRGSSGAVSSSTQTESSEVVQGSGRRSGRRDHREGG